MNNNLLLFLLVIGFTGCSQTGSRDNPVSESLAFRADELLVEEYVKNWDTLSITPIDNISASKRLNSYLASIISDTSIVVRFVNDTDYRVLHHIKYVWNTDTLETTPLDTMYLLSMCWVIQNHPDSLRYIFIRNINDPHDTTIVDTAVFARKPLQRMEAWAFVDSVTIKANNWPFARTAFALPSGIRAVIFRKLFPHSTGYTRTVADYWSRRRKFRLIFSSLYHPFYCGKVETDQKTEDVLLHLDVLDILCRTQEVGAFKNAFTVPLALLNPQTQEYQVIE